MTSRELTPRELKAYNRRTLIARRTLLRAYREAERQRRRQEMARRPIVIDERAIHHSADWGLWIGLGCAAGAVVWLAAIGWAWARSEGML